MTDYRPNEGPMMTIYEKFRAMSPEEFRLAVESAARMAETLSPLIEAMRVSGLTDYRIQREDGEE